MINICNTNLNILWYNLRFCKFCDLATVFDPNELHLYNLRFHNAIPHIKTLF